MPPAGPIDVVIPVYNAPGTTRVCIESLYAHLGSAIGDVHVHDNASGAETVRMLDSLALPRLRVHHAPSNTGFGDAVNQGVQRARSSQVLVLNSDVRADDDFLTPLAEAMERHERLAAVTPSGNTFATYALERYAARDGCVVTHNLYAYAFLVRRDLFLKTSGFDPAFGLGYYEDSDLSRRWIAAGHWLGVHRHSLLYHEVHGSFGDVPAYRELMARNRKIYFERYPGARRRVLLVSGCARGTDLAGGIARALDEVLEAGGEVRWMASEPPREIPALGVRGERWSAARALRWLLRKRRKAFGSFTDLWLLDDAPAAARFLGPVASRLGLEREPRS